MNMTDTAILIFWVVCLIRGIFRGPVNELFSIAGVWGGLITASFAFSTISKSLPGWMGTMQLRDLIFFLLVFAAMYLLLTIAGIIATYLFDLRRSGWIKRTMGAGFGVLKGMLVVAALLVPLVAFLPKQSTWMGRSIILPYENKLSEKMARAISSAMHEQFLSHIDGYKTSWRFNGVARNGQ